MIYDRGRSPKTIGSMVQDVKESQNGQDMFKASIYYKCIDIAQLYCICKRTPLLVLVLYRIGGVVPSTNFDFIERV